MIIPALPSVIAVVAEMGVLTGVHVSGWYSSQIMACMMYIWVVSSFTHRRSCGTVEVMSMLNSSWFHVIARSDLY